ncbi:hypothetical protein JW935_09915 [candidate division KSB1 bacterium]|nr:hypothetical protein [candidate division KSB1 bacterium]
MIIKKYHPERIYQWGYFHGDYFSEISDIDIAIGSITDAETFINLYGDATALTDFSVDVVQLERIEPEFSELIREKSRVVYER